jgi:hypothetical protein
MSTSVPIRKQSSSNDEWRDAAPGKTLEVINLASAHAADQENRSECSRARSRSI